MEYVIVVAAVVAAVIVFAGYIKTNLQTGYKSLSNTVANKIKNVAR